MFFINLSSGQALIALIFLFSIYIFLTETIYLKKQILS